jgi:hypothetical protein
MISEKLDHTKKVENPILREGNGTSHNSGNFLKTQGGIFSIKRRF